MGALRQEVRLTALTLGQFVIATVFRRHGEKKVCCSPSVREKKCLNGGCGVPDEEEGVDGDEADSGRFSEGETEEESLIDCGLKLRKVSFIEKVEDRS